MINPVFCQLEEIFAQIQNGEYDCKPYTLAIVIQSLSELAWNEVDRLCDECQSAIAIE